MLANGNDVVFNSSEESDEILSPGFPPEPSLIPTQSHHPAKVSQSQDEMELGIDLGRRLARLELDNEAAKEQLDKIKQKTGTTEEVTLDNSRIADMEIKVLSLEARLLSAEKQRFDANEKITKLEENVKTKNEEMLALKKMLAKHKDQEEKFAKLERDNCELTSQFVKLLDTCETLSDELESIKKMNSDLINNLKADTITSKDSKPTSEDQTRKIKIDCDKNQQTTFYDQGRYNLNYYNSPSTVDQDPAPAPIYLPHTSKAAESYYSDVVDEMSEPGPIFYPQALEVAEHFYYPQGAQLDMMYFSGSTSQSDEWKMMQRPDSGVHYC